MGGLMQDLSLATPLVSTMLLAGQQAAVDLSALSEKTVMSRKAVKTASFSYPPEVSLAYKTVFSPQVHAEASPGLEGSM